jgi:hypothetical protein
MWEMGWAWIPFMDFQILVMRAGDFLQAVVTGFCSVFFAGCVAPRRARAVRLVASTIIVVVIGGNFIYALLTGYYQDVPALEVIWAILLRVTTIFTAIAAGSIRDTPPTTEHSYTWRPPAPEDVPRG